MRYPAIERHSSLFHEYTELRVQENRSAAITLVNGNVVGNDRQVSGGVSARVWKDGVWGFASNPLLDDAAIARVVALASDNAGFLASREKRGGKALPRQPITGAWDLTTAKPRASQKEYMDFIRAIDAHLAAAYPDLQARTLAIRTLDMEKTLLASDGGSGFSMTPRAILYVILSSEVGADTVEVMDGFGGLGSYEDVFSDPALLYPQIEEMRRQLALKAAGVYATAGLHEVVLGPDLAGILAHEAIGHTVEADLVLGGSVAGDFLGKPVASELVTLVDYAHTALGNPCPVPVHIDDEGTEARDVILIERGILRNFMHNKETAAHFSAEPAGNARAYGFADEPLVRMRNTAIVPGSSTVEEMIDSIDDGYYLLRSSNGQADSTSEFMFGVTWGFEIKGGKLGRAIRDTTITGVAFDMLKTITALSGDMSWNGFGMCGKKQLIPVGMGGPAIRCKITMGGH